MRQVVYEACTYNKKLFDSLPHLHKLVLHTETAPLRYCSSHHCRATLGAAVLTVICRLSVSDCVYTTPTILLCTHSSQHTLTHATAAAAAAAADAPQHTT
eukprot:7640-Heterococcus_DN1.PRE.2